MITPWDAHLATSDGLESTSDKIIKSLHEDQTQKSLGDLLVYCLQHLLTRLLLMALTSVPATLISSSLASAISPLLFLFFSFPPCDLKVDHCCLAILSPSLHSLLLGFLSHH